VTFVAVQADSDSTGVALLAGEVTGRRVAAMEKQPAYVDVACARWQHLTGRHPRLERTGAEVAFPE
jgi:DNA modification methylase